MVICICAHGLGRRLACIIVFPASVRCLARLPSDQHCFGAPASSSAWPTPLLCTNVYTLCGICLLRLVYAASVLPRSTVHLMLHSSLRSQSSLSLQHPPCSATLVWPDDGVLVYSLYQRQFSSCSASSLGRVVRYLSGYGCGFRARGLWFTRFMGGVARQLRVDG